MYQAAYARFAATIRETGQFRQPGQRRSGWERSCTRGQWPALLPATGALTRLTPGQLAGIPGEAGAAIDAPGGAFTMPRTTLAATAARASAS